MYYIGVDVGSVSTDIVMLNENEVVDSLYLRTKGRPISAIKEGFKFLSTKYTDTQILGVGTTGSGREIASYVLGADAVKMK